MDVSLSGMAIVVTGAANGAGEAARLAAELGAEAVEEDLADSDTPGIVGAATRRRLGCSDGPVNPAGLTTRAELRTATPEVWDRPFAVNARAAFLLVAEALAGMIGRAAPGSIVNILSRTAPCGGPSLAVHAATNGALLTRNAADARPRDRVRVNGIGLGWTDTPAERSMQAGTLGKGEGWLREVAVEMPLGRPLGPEEAARLELFLLSGMSAPMTGEALDLEQWVAGAPPS